MHLFSGRPAVVVIGGGYGGVIVVKALDDVADVVLVHPKDTFVHNVASLRALVDPSWLPRIYLPYDPDGGSGQRPGVDELIAAEQVAQAKGRDMMVDRFSALLGLTDPAGETAR